MWYVGYRGICCTVVELLLPNRRCMVVWSVLRLLVLVVLQKDTGIIVDEMVVLPPTTTDFGLLLARARTSS
jgi:hypothetical protein